MRSPATTLTSLQTQPLEKPAQRFRGVLVYRPPAQMAYTKQQQQQPNVSFGLSCEAEIRGTDPGAETVEPVPSYQIFDRLRRGWAMPKVSETAPGLVGS